MNRSLGFALTLMALPIGCMRDEASVQQEQQRERQELAQEQQRERRELAQDQNAALGEARQDAREELVGRTEAAREEHQDVNEANRELAATVALACTGVTNPDACPIDDTAFRTHTDGDQGVSVTLADGAGSQEEVQRRIDCYRARVSLRGAPTEQCLIDIADENVTVQASTVRGHVVVELESTDANVVTRLRDRSREFFANLSARADRRQLRN